MSKAKLVIQWINDWANLMVLIIAVIALIYTIAFLELVRYTNQD